MPSIAGHETIDHDGANSRQTPLVKSTKTDTTISPEKYRGQTDDHSDGVSYAIDPPTKIMLGSDEISGEAETGANEESDPR